jgi:ELWxxDGT repeat protein
MKSMLWAGCAFLALSCPVAAQLIEVTPEELEFGEIDVGSAQMLPCTIESTEPIPSRLENIELTEDEFGTPYTGSDFSFVLNPDVPLPILLFDHPAPAGLTDVDGTLFFIADDGILGSELWKSDGTPEGTIMVKDIHIGRSSSNISPPVAVNGILFFAADDGSSGRELWKSDGTPEGTVLVKDINTTGPSHISHMTDVDGILFFRAIDEIGYALYKSDGTPGGTVHVKAPDPDNHYSVTWLASSNGFLFFSGDDGLTGNELWISDGTPAGTYMLKDINPGSDTSQPRELTDVGGTLFFFADDGSTGYALWKSDGTPEGTVMVEDINPSTSHSSGQKWLTSVNGTLYFKEDGGIAGDELWMSDGTPAGTLMVKDINPFGDSNPYRLTDVNGTLFFAANDGVAGAELWKSDGTPGGTVMVKDINTEPGKGSLLYDMCNVNGTLFFIADDGITGLELWKSDGTFEGTDLVKDISPKEDWAYYPGNLTASNGMLFFTAHDGETGRELWKSDGTLEGTVLVKDIHPMIGTEVDVEVTYAPTGAGDHLAFLHVESDSAPPHNNIYVPLSGSGIGAQSETIRSYLGDDPWWCFPDWDLFRFEGEEGEEITITLEAADGSASGEHATLILKDKIKGVCVLEKDKSALPNEITVVLPAAGNYRILVAEQAWFMPGAPFIGEYDLTLESSGNAYQTFEPTCWVE